MTARAHHRRAGTAEVIAAIAIGVACVIGAVVLTGWRSGGGSEPRTDGTVVATLRTGAQSYSEDLRTLLSATRADPEDRQAAKAAARGLIDEGRSLGDSRLVGAAIGILRPFLDPAPDTETLLLAATARQYQHDFTGALTLLDTAIALSPGDAGALMSRATIQTVRGRFDAADADCRRLFAAGRADLGFLCQATARTLTADAPAAYERLAAIVGQTRLLDPELESYAVGLMGEIAALQDRPVQARTHFETVLAEDPEALRVRMMLADIELSSGDAKAALDLLAEVPKVDGVLLRRAIAAEKLGDSAVADPAKAELGRRFRQNLALGLTAHAREETRYFLELESDPARALERAIVNWGFQHEIDDAQLLIDAAVAAGKPEAAAPVLDWMADQGVAVPTLRVPDAVREARG